MSAIWSRTDARCDSLYPRAVYELSTAGWRDVAEPEEIAQSALYLASDASSFTTGAVLRVDCGVSISRN